MFKVCLLIALAIACANAQSSASGGEAAAEPYSYGYETESHSASEQRDPSGKVTGYYTIADADGRQRRVEYYADESGFHAKVQTNEVGTKSDNSADVEVLASPPNREQYAVQSGQQQQQATFAQQAGAAQQRVVSSSQQFVGAPQRSTSVSNIQQPYGYNQYGYNQYGYNPAGYGYGANYAPSGSGANFASSSYTSSQGYPGYAYSPGYASGSGVGYGSAAYGSYNNHLPSSYYKSIQTSQSVQPSSYSASGPGGAVVSRYVSSSPVVGGAVPASANSASYRSSYQSYGSGVAAPGAVGYQSSAVAPASSGYQSVGSSSANYQKSSSNYIVLKKRNSETAEAE